MTPDPLSSAQSNPNAEIVPKNLQIPTFLVRFNTSSFKRWGIKRYPEFQNGPALSAVRNYSITASLRKWMQHRHSQPESHACRCGSDTQNTMCTSQFTSTSRRLEQHSLCLTHKFLLIEHSTLQFVRSQVGIGPWRDVCMVPQPLSASAEKHPRKGQAHYLSYSSKFVTIMVMNYVWFGSTAYCYTNGHRLFCPRLRIVDHTGLASQTVFIPTQHHI
jgi:hypothetical protein